MNNDLTDIFYLFEYDKSDNKNIQNNNGGDNRLWLLIVAFVIILYTILSRM